MRILKGFLYGLVYSTPILVLAWLAWYLRDTGVIG